jgi:tetratricopeptide (TPR) repeat protein
MTAGAGLATLQRAFALHQAGDLDAAEAAYTQVLAQNPDEAAALINGGALALTRGDHARALERLERAVRVLPDNAPAWNNLGMALIHSGRNDDALGALDRATTLAPDYAQAHNNRGIAFARLHRPVDARAAFERALALQPGYAEAALNLGEQCNAAGDGVAAAAAYERVLAAHPQHAGARTGHAFARALQGDLTGADVALAAITTAHPLDRTAWQTLGAVRNWAWDHAGAESAFRRALALEADNAEAGFGIAAALLGRADYPRGWAAFEHRPQRNFVAPALAGLPSWNGETLDGTLLVYGEQGFGDVVQFARFLAAARGRVRRLVLLLDGYLAPLGPLLATLPAVDQVVAHEQAVAEAAASVSLLSLPHRLGIGPADIAMQVPYVGVPAARAASWSGRVAPYRTPRIGLAWSVLARDAHPFVTRHKSVPASVLMPVIARADATFFSLQPGAAGDPAAFGALAGRVVDMRDRIGDFADTAALLEQMDLVLSADTAVAHVAGALGKPVWLLDRFNTCWRWRQGIAPATWYPSMRILRQQRFGDWDSVARAVTYAFNAWRATL